MLLSYTHVKFRISYQLAGRLKLVNAGIQTILSKVGLLADLHTR